VKNKLFFLLSVAVAFLMISGPAFAHHGKFAFDMDKVTVVKGTVTKFEFINPHALIYFDAMGEKGGIEHWIAETNSNNHLSRGGYDKNSLKAGEQVIVTGHRAKNGANTLELQCQECSVTDMQGKVLLGYYF
jgi:hypothetical protein